VAVGLAVIASPAGSMPAQPAAIHPNNDCLDLALDGGNGPGGPKPFVHEAQYGLFTFRAHCTGGATPTGLVRIKLNDDHGNQVYPAAGANPVDVLLQDNHDGRGIADVDFGHLPGGQDVGASLTAHFYQLVADYGGKSVEADVQLLSNRSTQTGWQVAVTPSNPSEYEPTQITADLPAFAGSGKAPGGHVQFVTGHGSNVPSTPIGDPVAVSASDGHVHASLTYTFEPKARTPDDPYGGYHAGDSIHIGVQYVGDDPNYAAGSSKEGVAAVIDPLSTTTTVTADKSSADTTQKIHLTSTVSIPSDADPAIKLEGTVGFHFTAGSGATAKTHDESSTQAADGSYTADVDASVLGADT
jgi:hypothetical protein